MRAHKTTGGIYLVLDVTDGAPERLAAALGAAPLQAVRLRAATAAAKRPEVLLGLIAAAQAKECAALIDDDARLARTLRADGVHLTFSADIAERFAEARAVLGNRFIVGADAGASRHDAMALAEAGADYIGFGLAGRTEDDLEVRREQIDWWAEIFQVPCVAFDVIAAEEAGGLLRAGADFIGLHIGSAMPMRDVQELVQAAANGGSEPAREA